MWISAAVKGPGEVARRSIAAVFNRAEPQRIHYGSRSCAHGEDVAQNSAYAGCRALKRFDKTWVIVGLDFEGAGPAVAYVYDAGVLSRALHNQFAAGGQAFQVDTR